MAGKGIGQTKRRRELGAEQARPENPQRHVASLARHSADAEPIVTSQEGLQFDDVLRKLPLVAGQRAPQRLGDTPVRRSEEHTSELQSLMRISYAVFCLKK